MGGGVLFFVACLCAGLYRLFAPNVRSVRWRGLAIIAFGFVGLIPIVTVLPPINASRARLSGTYKGTFGGGSHTFVLRPNGDFDQRFVSDDGKIYSTKGHWEIDKSYADYVSFSNVIDTLGEGGAAKKPSLSTCGGSPYMLGDSIYFNEDLGIHIHRISRDTSVTLVDSATEMQPSGMQRYGTVPSKGTYTVTLVRPRSEPRPAIGASRSP